jgi:hypothetical protein
MTRCVDDPATVLHLIARQMGQGLLVIKHRRGASLQGSEIEPGPPNGDGARLAASFVCVTGPTRRRTGERLPNRQVAWGIVLGYSPP